MRQKEAFMNPFSIGWLICAGRKKENTAGKQVIQSHLVELEQCAHSRSLRAGNPHYLA